MMMLMFIVCSCMFAVAQFTSATEYKLYEPKNKGDEFEPKAVKFDSDDPDHMTWVFNRATERAAQFSSWSLFSNPYIS